MSVIRVIEKNKTGKGYKGCVDGGWGCYNFK